MRILLILALAASADGMKAAPGAVQVQAAPMPRGGGSWFQPESRPFGSSLRISPAERPQDPAPPVLPAMGCTIRILKGDPKLDAEIVRPAPPDLDPKIVRPSPCK